MKVLNITFKAWGIYLKNPKKGVNMIYSSRVRSQSNRVNGYSRDLRATIKKAQNNITGSYNYWEGQGARAFDKVNNTYYLTGKNMEEKLSSIETKFKYLAQQLEKEERQERVKTLGFQH